MLGFNTAKRITPFGHAYCMETIWDRLNKGMIVEHGDPGVRLGSLLAVIRVLGLTDKLLTGLDPYESDLGRASADRVLPKRVRR